jgi:hypothetical protein
LVGDNSNAAENIVLLHEFFFTENAETNKCAIRLFISKIFQISEEEIDLLNESTKDVMFFRFELKSSSPFFNCKIQHKSAGNNNGIGSSNNLKYLIF